MIELLNNDWELSFKQYPKLKANVPCSVYSVLLDNKLIDDPFWRDNEPEALKLCEDDCTFTKKFTVSDQISSSKHISIKLNGIDTISTVKLNGEEIGITDNMHSTFEFDVKSNIKTGENTLEIHIDSPLEYVKKKQSKYKLWGVATTTDGFPHIRKPHYMFGWDWGPQLPDMGLWKDIELIYGDCGFIDNVFIEQHHSKDGVNLDIKTSIKHFDKQLAQIITITDPNNNETVINKSIINSETTTKYTIENPMLWWPNGYGEQNLYKVSVKVLCDEKCIDEKKYNIGLRTLTVSTQKDKWGSEFCFVVNGVKIFAMGADYIPEDNILPRCTKAKTEYLIQKCVEANFNCIRIWGGGHYATGEFMDLCDEYGLIVWQDFMFACCTYMLTAKTRILIEKEFRDNIIRLRNHCSLGILCGNNEMELAWLNWGIPKDDRVQQDYIELYERMLPDITEELCPDIFYWPASPSSGGGFSTPNDENNGDVHYWDVWHGNQPFEDYQKYYFRFCSEFGFESFPSMKTINTFATKEDLNPFSRIMESHQKCASGNTKILTYIADNYKYPYSFENMIYISQLLQADAIRYGVEHFRRNRGRCMGAIYWQLNDCWPGPSWSSIDSLGRKKALQFYAKKFFAPVLLSIKQEDFSIDVNVSNETRADFVGKVLIKVLDNSFNSYFEDVIDVNIDALTSLDVKTLDLSKYLDNNQYDRFVEYTLIDSDNKTVSTNTVLFCKPKHYNFDKPKFEVSVNNNSIHIASNCFATGVFLETNDEIDLDFSDNFFDISSSDGVYITLPENSTVKADDIIVLSVNDVSIN